MTKRQRVLWHLAILTLLATSWGCGMRPNRPEFAERMARSNRKLMLLAVQFRAAVLPISQPGPNVDEPINAPARALYKEIEDTVSKTRAEYAFASLPSKPSASAPAYLETYQKMLDTEDAIVQKPLRDVMAILEDNNIARASKWPLIDAKFNEAKGMESAALGAVRQAGQDYAKEHKYKLISERKPD